MGLIVNRLNQVMSQAERELLVTHLASRGYCWTAAFAEQAPMVLAIQSYVVCSG